MIDLGDRRAGVTLRFPFNTYAITGESITVGTNGTVKVYKNGVNTTEVTTGASFSEDFDGITGVHFAIIDTSQDGTFYAEGNDFQVMFQAATIDGKSINAWLGTFSLANRAGLMPTTAGRKLDVSSGGEAGVDWANIGSPTTPNDLSGTTVGTATTIGTTGIDAITADISANVATTDQIADAIADEPRSGHVTAGTIGAGFARVLNGTVTGTPTTTTMAASAFPSTHDDQYNNTRSILFTSGVLVGVRTVIRDYVNSTRTFTFDAVHTAPSAGDTFEIY